MELLAQAARARLRVDGMPVTDAGASFRGSVRAVVAECLAPRTQVIARWRPYRGSSVRGRLEVGAAPPPDATVHAASLTHPIGELDPAANARSGEAEGFGGVALAVARRFVAVVFPPARTRLALRAERPVAALITRRYRRLGAAYGVNLSASVASGDARTANRRLARAAAARVAETVRHGFDAPERASDAARPGGVRIAVRTWS